jgi:peptidoglycan/xylan/chitin deacetylase (PgdA/CDA1 family)
MMWRERVKYRTRVVTAYALHLSGLLFLWQLIALRRKAVVLMYHRVLSDDEQEKTGSHPGIVVSLRTFERHMSVLRRRFVVLSPDEFVRRMEESLPFPNSSCVVTFDDGWRDTYTNALPVLKRHGLPAVVFLPVNFIGRRRLFWREALTHLLVQVVSAVRNDPQRRPTFAALLAPEGLGGVVDIRDANPRAAVVTAIERCRALQTPEVDRLVEALAAELKIPLEDFSDRDGFIGWEEVETMSRNGIAFGGHGAEHYLLDRVPAVTADAEIRTSKDVLDARLAPPAATFSYPNGNWNQDVADQVQARGYRAAFTTRSGFVACDNQRFALPRYNIHEAMTSLTPMFLARITGLF